MLKYSLIVSFDIKVNSNQSNRVIKQLQKPNPNNIDLGVL